MDIEAILYILSFITIASVFLENANADIGAKCEWAFSPVRLFSTVCEYRSGTVNSKAFVGKVLLQIKWRFELTVHFKHE